MKYGFTIAFLLKAQSLHWGCSSGNIFAAFRWHEGIRLDPKYPSSFFKELTVSGKYGAGGLNVQHLAATDPKLELERVLSQLLEATTPVWGTLQRL